MARSSGRLLRIAILAFACYFVLAQVAAFVTSSPSRRSSGHRLRSRLRLEATKTEIAEAEKHAGLLQWAANTAAEKGLPAAVAMKAKADAAKAELEALKAGGSAPVAPAPVASAPVASAPVAAVTAAASHNSAEFREAQEHVNLMVWAAQTAEAKGMAQSAILKTKAEAALAAFEALKAGNPVEVSSASVASTSASSVSYVAPTPISTSAAPSKKDIEEAENHANLLAWAAKTAAAKGLPQAGQMQHSADEAAALSETLKSAANSASPSASKTSAGGSLSPDLMRFDLNSDGVIDQNELRAAYKELELIMWAAKTAEEKGLNEAASIRAKGDAFQETYKALEDMVQN